MDVPLLTTKFHFPLARQTLVPRPRLIERLQQGLQGVLTLISGSAGSGKTTLLSEWRAGAGKHITAAWLSLDERDNEIQLFLTYLAASLDCVQAGVKNDVHTILQSPHGLNIEVILTALINSLSTIHTDFVLVLEDYHLITNPEIHSALSFLIDNIPFQMHLVILTRIDPPLPLARLRSRGKLVELRDSDLRFRLEEAGEFLKQGMRLEITDQDIALLEARTEGWISGLQMAALSIQGRDDVPEFIRAFSGSHRFVLDYLTEEVLNRQSGPVREFLLKTSVLNRLNASLCQAVMDCEDAQSILEYLDSANIFMIPLDNERIWYRYHHLFADLLKVKLHQNDPAMADTIRKKAALWCGQHGLVSEAVEYALAANDFEIAADHIEMVVRSMQNFDNRSAFKNWLDRLPEETVESHPWLCAARALALTSFGHLEPARRFLRLIEANLVDEDALIQEKTLLESLVAGINAWIAEKENDFDSTLRFVKHAQSGLPEEHPINLFITILEGDVYFIRGDLVGAELARSKVLRIAKQTGKITYQVLMLLGLGHICLWRGQLEQALHFYQSAAELVELTRLPKYYLASSLTSQASIYLKWDQLDEARRLTQKAQAIYLSSLEDHNLSAFTQIVAAQISMARSQYSEAEVSLSKAWQYLKDVAHYPDVQADWDLCRTRLWLAQGEVKKAERWLDAMDISPTCPGYCVEQYVLAQASVWLSKGRLGVEGCFQQALDLLSCQADEAERFYRNGRLVEFLILKTMVLLEIKQIPEAMQVLEKALLIALPQNYLRPFMDEVRSLMVILKHLQVEDNTLGSFIDQIFHETPPDCDLKPAMLRLIEPLTERERDVLRLMAAGLSNSEIAQELYLSLNTVKTHTRGIYGKLGVSNRTQATIQAQELGLV